ncbi:MAG: hypothetical protein WCO89_09835, partial [Syntrophus sp. (in: bacteria)]
GGQSDQSGQKWKNNRFSIKSRIQIDDDTRTVAEHFLVDLELAFLEGLTLNAPIFLGPLGEDELPTAKTIVQEAARLLSGFGAFRSRGYGRGSVTIDWDEAEKSKAEDFTDPSVIISLKALTHVRSKPIDPGSAQKIATALAITPEQFKGWLAKAYFTIHGNWPTPEQMAAIHIGTLYPSPAPGVQTFPPPMTTLQNEAKAIQDLHGASLEERKNAKMNQEEENFFATKTKPLRSGWFVTDGTEAHEFRAGRRMRNNIDNTAFTTTEAGLFVQEYLPSGVIFSGRLSLAACKDDFAKQVKDILKGIYPTIKGALFTVSLHPDGASQNENGPRLVTEPFPYQANTRTPTDTISLATQRQYNTTLRRPRRPLPVVMPGSVLQSAAFGECRNVAVSWCGFSQSITSMPFQESFAAHHVSEKQDKLPPVDKNLHKPLRKFTRAQAGQLREMLHPKLSDKALTDSLDHRIEKYTGKEKSHGHLKDILASVKKELNDGGRQVMNSYVQALLEEYALIQWEKKQKGELL